MRRRIGLVVLLILGACGGSSPVDTLPDITLERIDISGSFELAAVDETTTVVNLWATWCAPCRREIPDLERFHRSNSDSIDLIGINIGDDPEQIIEFLDGLTDPTVTYTQLADPLADVADHLGTSTLPVTLVIDGGRIVERVDGPIELDELNELIEPYRA